MYKGIQFIIELTNRCNFKCKYCYLEQSEGISHNVHHIMTTEIGEKTISYIYDNFYQRYDRIFIDFLDGEPLTNFATLRHMVNYSRTLEGEKSKFIFRFTTNGSMLTQEIIKFTQDNNIYFNISVDGLPETHDKNRVYHDGKGTSQDVFDKLEVVSNIDNVGIVSTYSANTLSGIVEGTEYLQKRGLKHIETNFCMGKVDHYDIKQLKGEYKRVIDLYLERYRNGDFSCRYIILDDILSSLYCGRNEKSECIHPYKITYDGIIKSCDRIPIKFNKDIATIFDERFETFDEQKCHYCIDKETEKCTTCQYRTLCTPCNIYMNDMFDVQEDNDSEPVFCIVMKCLIEKAIQFHEENKRNGLIAMHFNPELRRLILKGEYDCKKD